MFTVFFFHIHIFRSVTSNYCHAKPGESASSYIDLSTDDVAEAELTVEHHYKVKKSIKNDK